MSVLQLKEDTRCLFVGERIVSGELALDTLLTLAGIASFAADQKHLDDRVKGIIGKS